MRIAATIGVVLTSALCWSTLASAQGRDAIHVGTGNEAWEESTKVNVSQKFECRSITAASDAEIYRDGVRTIALQVNGTKVAESDVSGIVRDMNRQGGFSYVSFACTPDFYAFTFYPAAGAGGQPYVYQRRLPRR